MNLLEHIRIVPDFPIKGIQFYDLASLLAKPEVWGQVVDMLAEKAKAMNADVIAGIESRGFLSGLPVAMKLGLPFVMIRKKGKLPGDVISYEYDLEYGSDVIELQPDMIGAGKRVVLIDDLLATGGTMAAAEHLIEKAGCDLAGSLCIIELDGLGGADKLSKPFHALVKAPC